MNFTKPPAASQLMRKRLRNYIMTPFDDPSTFVRESRRTPVQGVCRYKAVWHLPARRDLPHCVRHIPCRSQRGPCRNPSLSGICRTACATSLAARRGTLARIPLSPGFGPLAHIPPRLRRGVAKEKRKSALEQARR